MKQNRMLDGVEFRRLIAVRGMPDEGDPGGEVIVFEGRGNDGGTYLVVTASGQGGYLAIRTDPERLRNFYDGIGDLLSLLESGEEYRCVETGRANMTAIHLTDRHSVAGPGFDATGGFHGYIYPGHRNP